MHCQNPECLNAINSPNLDAFSKGFLSKIVLSFFKNLKNFGSIPCANQRSGNRLRLPKPNLPISSDPTRSPVRTTLTVQTLEKLGLFSIVQSDDRKSHGGGPNFRKTRLLQFPRQGGPVRKGGNARPQIKVCVLVAGHQTSHPGEKSL